MSYEPPAFTAPPEPPKGGSTVSAPNDRVDLTVNEMVQHVHQHSPEPRDLDYRAQAFQFALSVTSRYGRPYTSKETISVAAKIESYLRDGIDPND